MPHAEGSRATGRQGDITQHHLPVTDYSETLEVEREGRRREAQLCNDLASILQLATDLKPLGLILKARILQLKPPRREERDP